MSPVAISLPPPRLPLPGLAFVYLGHSVDLLHGNHCPSVLLKLNFSSKSSLLFLWPGLGHNESVGIKICFIQFIEVGPCICYSYIILTEQAKKCACFTAHNRIWLRNELLKEVTLQSGPWSVDRSSDGHCNFERKSCFCAASVTGYLLPGKNTHFA